MERSRNNCSRGNAINIRYSECVSHLNYPACKAQCNQSGCILFSTYSVKSHDFVKKIFNLKHVFWFPLQLCTRIFSFQDVFRSAWSKMYVGLQLKYSLLLSYFNEPWILSTGFKKISNIKFYEIPSSGMRVMPKRVTDRHDRDNGVVSHFWKRASKNQHTHTHTHTHVPLSYRFIKSSINCFSNTLADGISHRA